MSKSQSLIEQETRLELCAAYHLAHKFNWTDLIYTHISARIPDQPNCFLINRFGLQFNEITPDNLIKVDFEGKLSSKSNDDFINPAGSVIHGAIHQKRSDVACVIHLHTTNGVAISNVKDGLLPISQHALHLYGDIAYHGYEGLALREDEKETIINDLGLKNVLILRNHGFLTTGDSIAKAFMLMYMLEKAAQIQIKTLSQGLEIVKIPEEICKRTYSQVILHRDKHLKLEWKALLRELDIDFFKPLLQVA